MTLAPLIITVDVEDVRKSLKKLKRRVRDLRPTMRKLEVYLREHAVAQRRTQGAHGGRRWAPPEAKYRVWKQNVVGHLRPLELAPETLVYLPSYEQKKSPWHVFQARRDGMIFGSSHPFAERLEETGGVNQFGESYPARPVLAYRDEQLSEMAFIVQEDIMLRTQF